MTKKSIPKALREQVWLRQFGNKFEAKCPINWCNNTITVFNYECGHNKPESRKGATTLENLVPICGKCNKSMSNSYTIDEWNKLDQKLQVEDIDKNTKVKKMKNQVKNKAKWYCCFFV